MTSLLWQTTGTGDRDLVLLHGWGLNAGVWSCIIPRLTPQFFLHLVDLPGYGRSRGYGALTLEQMSEEVASLAPDGALWLGGSLGGLALLRASNLRSALGRLDVPLLRLYGYLEGLVPRKVVPPLGGQTQSRQPEHRFCRRGTCAVHFPSGTFLQGAV